MIKVCHVTSAHDVEDDRIFLKECVSLAANGYEVYLVERGDTYNKNGVHITGVGHISGNRLKRMTAGAGKAFRQAIEINADVYQLHDPELLPYALKLKRKGKIVIFDSHEDVPAQISDKTWILKPLRVILSKLYKCYETYVAKRIDAVVTATGHIAENFSGRSNRVAVINNYPRLDDIQYHDTSFVCRDAIICYAGGIDDLRGEEIMLEAMKKVDGTLLIAGDHEVTDRPEVCTKYLGRLDRQGINSLYGRAVVGLCILKPTLNYYYSQPIKIYEYMAAGIPYICSDFPSWIKLANESGAGICIDPLDSDKLAEEINDLLLNRNKAEQMGHSGYQYVTSNCTWSVEEKKLFSLYEEVTSLKN